jgi:arylsulfatase A-like enzyme
MTNVALVVMDTLRKDSFDEQFNWLPGTRYENAWSSCGWTGPAHATLFGGRYPSELGVTAKSPSLDCERRVLAERLADAGYTTRGFSANANLVDAFEFTRGFDEFDHSWRGHRRDPDVVDWADFVSETRGEGSTRFLRAVMRCFGRDVNTTKSLKLGARMKARDLDLASIAGKDDGAQQVLKTLRSMNFGEKEFFFMNLMEAHGPYNAPEEYRTVDVDVNPSFEHIVGEGPDDPEALRQAYDDCVRYLSDVYRDIFAELRTNFDVVVTLADHGEMFREDGVWAHAHGVHPDLVHVPLSVYTGENEVRVCEETVGLVDVYRTVLHAAGLTDEDARGRDLRSDPGSGTYLTERHGLRPERLSQMENEGYEQATIDKWDQRLSGVVLENGDYGWETVDGFRVAGDTDETTLRAELRAFWDDIDARDVDSQDLTDVPEDVRERLGELGYV